MLIGAESESVRAGAFLSGVGVCTRGGVHDGEGRGEEEKLTLRTSNGWVTRVAKVPAAAPEDICIIVGGRVLSSVLPVRQWYVI